MRLLLPFVLAFTWALAVTHSYAQSYPTKPLRLIVPFAPGGGADIVARAFGPPLGESLGQNILIDNRPGAGTLVGAELAARAAPDGYTLFISPPGTLAINPSLYPKLPYDPIEDFAPIALVAIGPIVLVAHPKVPATSIPELIRYAKARPGQLNFASSGSGGAPHVTGELFKMRAGIEITHVPYKGAGPATTALLSGEVQLMFTGVGAAINLIRSGHLKGLAVAGSHRFPALADLPTIAEFLPGFDASTWLGILAPAGTPRQIIARLNEELTKAAKRPAMVTNLPNQGYVPVTSSPEEFAAFIKSETVKWTEVVRKSSARPD